jgi:C1A family cysteine protease
MPSKLPSPYFFVAVFILLFSFSFFQGQALRQVFFSKKAELPARYDLRQHHLVPKIREQAWGTCWIFASYRAIESNLMKTRNWNEVESGEPYLAVYHLDKYSGFTRRGDDSHVNETWYSGQGQRYPGSNTDDLDHGLIVHLGGDFKAAAAFLSNTRGAVQQRLTPVIPRGGDHLAFGDLPTEGVLLENNYSYFFPRHIEWLSLHGSELEKRERIKKAIIKHGAVASSQVMEEVPLGHHHDGLPIHGTLDLEVPLNHALNLIGWDDDLVFGDHQGAWIAQDSDHRTPDDQPLGTFYILFDDVHAAKDPWMGGVSFNEVTLAPFDQVYSHSLHGFRYSTEGDEQVQLIANRFVIKKTEQLEGIGMYTLNHDVSYTLSLHESLNGQALLTHTGAWSNPGFHYVDLRDHSFSFTPGQEIFVRLELSDHTYAYSASATLEVLLGSSMPEWGEPIDVYARAQENEGHFQTPGGQWLDFAPYVHPSNEQSTHHHASTTPTASLALNLYTSTLNP